jgi:putative tributyrin esterase
MPRRVMPLLLLVFFAGGATAAVAQPLPVKTVEFAADSVGRKMKYNVVLPAGYDSSDQRYPVLYLLHGLTSNYTLWAKMNVPLFARQYKLIVVMPDVGNSWYANWSKSDDGQKNRWEDFIVKDLIGHVDATYRTVASRSGRAINGLSMGGYGAIMLGLRHPDMFCSIGSHSGALAFAQRTSESLASGKPPAFMLRDPSDEPNKLINIDGFNSPRERTPRGQIFANAAECDAHDPFKLVLKIDRDKLPHIYVDCGTDDRLIEASQKFARVLMESKIPFTYAQSRGGHVPPYWAREVEHSMAVQYSVLQRSLAQASPPEKPAAAAGSTGAAQP